MPLDRLVLILVVVIAAAMATIWLASLVLAATQIPFAWLALIPVGIAVFIGWRVISDRVGSDEDDHYDKVPRK